MNTGALENFQPSYLKKIMFCGEAMPTKQFNQWRENNPDAMFANIYGPTETTVDCTYYIVDRDLRMMSRCQSAMAAAIRMCSF